MIPEMISDDELENLPEDPEHAFIEFEKICRQRLNDSLSRLEQDNWGSEFKLEYMNRIVAASRALEIPGLGTLEVPPAGRNEHEEYRNFVQTVDFYVMQLRIRNAKRNRKFSVQLDPDTKNKIRAQIERVRRQIDETDLSEKRKAGIRRRLDEVLAELEKARTSYGSIAALAIGIALVSQESGKALEGAKKSIESIAYLVGKAEEAEEHLRKFLSPPTERKLLAPPRNETSKTRSLNLDDEIPF